MSVWVGMIAISVLHTAYTRFIVPDTQYGLCEISPKGHFAIHRREGRSCSPHTIVFLHHTMRLAADEFYPPSL
jgi:hypothetical protein